MTFNNTSKRLERPWTFVDQFAKGDAALRSDFDIAFNDAVTSVNSAVAYLESLVAAAVSTPTDQRYLGRKSANPTTRNDGSALAVGDFYSHSTTNQTWVYTSTGWARSSDTATPSAFVAELLDDVDATTFRGSIGLGSAAVQPATAFATSAQGVAADGAIPAVGQAKITDFNAIDTTRSAQFWADNAATNGPGIAEEFAVTYTRREAGSGFTLALSVESGRLFLRRRKNATWGAWTEFNGALARIETTDADLATRSGAYRLQNTCANLPSVNPFECIVSSPNGTDVAQVAIRATDGQMWRRIRTSGAWTAWVRIVDASNVDALTNVPFINQNTSDMSASRAWDTAYQNTTSRPIHISVDATSVQTYSWDFRLSPDGVAWQVQRLGSSKTWSDGGFLNAFVPPGWYYKLQKNSGTAPGLVWREMK